MRILHVIAGGEDGGAETFAQDAIVALAERGVEQQVIARPHPRFRDGLRAAGVALTPLGFSRLDRLSGASDRIREQAQRFAADLVHAWMGRAASFVPAGMPCPAIGWFGGYYNLKYYRHADVFVGVTRDIRAYLVKAGVPEDRAFVVHTFGTLPPAIPVDRAALDTPAEAPVVLVLSRLHEKKGIGTMLEALSRLPGVYLWLAGSGPDAGRYRRLCRRLGLDDRVRFLGWRSDRGALLAAADIVALPSRYEPFGTVMAEAWGMARPLIATRTAGPSQYATDDVDCLLCPAEDAVALAACIGRLRDDAALCRRLAASGRQTYERLFSKAVVIDSLLQTYRAAVDCGRRDPKRGS